MPYTTVDFRHDKWVALTKLAHLANVAWDGISSKRLEWRLNYYSQFGAGRVPPNHLFRMIEYSDECGEDDTVPQGCAFVSIFPLVPKDAEAHQNGILSQYLFEPSHLQLSRAKSTKSYHYIQSLYIDDRHRDSGAANRALRKSILDLLKGQYCGYAGRPYRLYCEAILPAGRSLALSQGFVDEKRRSFEEHSFYFFDSDLHTQGITGSPESRHEKATHRLANTIAELWI